MRVNQLWWLLSLTFMLIACNKQVDYIGTTSASDNPYLLQSDTFEAVATIYRPDSFKTSAKDNVYAGIHNDAVFGNISCTPYLRFSLPSSIPEPANNSYYDSVILIMHAAKTYYGDTNTVYGLSVYELSQDMSSPDDNVFYNNHSFTANGQSLGSTSVVLRPSTGDSIRIKLKDDFGSTLFNLFKNKSSTIKDSAIFRTVYKGFAIKTLAGSNAIYSFPVTDSSLYLRIYYHNDIGKPEKKQVDFTVLQKAYAFTNISTNRSGTALAALDAATEMPATNILANNELTQVRTRFSFPGFKEVLKIGSYVKIINANLEIKPVATRYNGIYPFPLTLNLYTYSFAAALEGPMQTSGGQSEQNGNLYIDDSYGRDSKYSFDITSYLNNEISASSYTTKKLVVVIPNTTTNLTSLVAGSTSNQQYRSKLVLSVLVSKSN